MLKYTRKEQVGRSGAIPLKRLANQENTESVLYMTTPYLSAGSFHCMLAY